MAKDQAFEEVLMDEKLTKPEISFEKPGDAAIYYVRTSAIDAQGYEGDFSEQQSFEVKGKYLWLPAGISRREAPLRSRRHWNSSRTNSVAKLSRSSCVQWVSRRPGRPIWVVGRAEKRRREAAAWQRAENVTDLGFRRTNNGSGRRSAEGAAAPAAYAPPRCHGPGQREGRMP